MPQTNDSCNTEAEQIMSTECIVKALTQQLERFNFQKTSCTTQREETNDTKNPQKKYLTYSKTGDEVVRSAWRALDSPKNNDLKNAKRKRVNVNCLMKIRNLNEWLTSQKSLPLPHTLAGAGSEVHGHHGDNDKNITAGINGCFENKKSYDRLKRLMLTCSGSYYENLQITPEEFTEPSELSEKYACKDKHMLDKDGFFKILVNNKTEEEATKSEMFPDVVEYASDEKITKRCSNALDSNKNTMMHTIYNPFATDAIPSWKGERSYILPSIYAAQHISQHSMHK